MYDFLLVFMGLGGADVELQTRQRLQNRNPETHQQQQQQQQACKKGKGSLVHTRLLSVGFRS